MANTARILIALLGLTVYGCAAGEECRFGTECPSGVCLPEGVCASGDDAGAMSDAGAMDAGVADDAGVTDGEVTEDAGAADAGPPACHDGDDRLTASEVPLPLEVPLARRIARDATVDTTGTVRADGTRLWDFEGPFAGDVDESFMRVSTAGTWYAGSFAGATYALPLGVDDELLGVFRADATGVTLLGVVSPTGGAARTELTYDPPAPVWRFPLEIGASWDVTSSVSGVASGVPSVYTERWRVEVDARGDVGTPAGVRSVLRVNTQITRTVGALPVELRRQAYVEPCLGTIAQVFADGADEEPTRATELWRVAP